MDHDETPLPLRCRLDAYPYAAGYAARSDDELLSSFYAACDGVTPFETLLAADDRFADVALADGVVWLERPLGACDARDEAGERAMILAAHAADGFFALGGHALAHDGPLDYVFCFARTCGGPRPELAEQEAEVCAIRRDEAVLSSRIAGCQPLFIDLPDNVVRGEDDEKAALIEKLKRTLAVMLYRLIDERRPKHVFAPAAMGADDDRRMIFDIVLEFFEQGYFPDTAFHLYEDFPESASPINVDDFLARFENAYIDVRPWTVDVSASIDQKAELAAVFASLDGQDESGRIAAVARQSVFALPPSQRGEAMRAAERFWTLSLTFDLNRFTEQSWT